MHPRRTFVVALTVAALAITPTIAAAGGGGASPPARVASITHTHPASILAVPKFVLHAGLAFGAFHHFLYLPFKAGKFTGGGFFSKSKTYIEGGLAALFVYHEVKLALADAQHNKALKLLVTPLTAAVALFSTLVAKVKAHKLDATSMTSAQAAVTMIETHAKTSGSAITEGVPSAGQLAAGSVS
jgi:hypothetical protein